MHGQSVRNPGTVQNSQASGDTTKHSVQFQGAKSQFNKKVAANKDIRIHLMQTPIKQLNEVENNKQHHSR